MRWRGAVLAAVVAMPAMAQTDDRSYLTALLEDNLSGAGRSVVITGFAGALSSQASLDQMTIADDQGVWLTLRGVVLDWNRSALLRGQVSVNELTAQEIVLDRLPVADDGALPSPEARGFSLPELPVSVEIGSIAAEKITLGATVLGQPVTGTLSAALSLANGEGQGSLTLARTDDGPDGAFTLDASYANGSRRLVLDLSAAEGANGIAATLLNLPGRPSVDLTISGAGPLDDFSADIALRTDNEPRLSGEVVLSGLADGGLGFRADLAGNPAPLFLPEYAEFFGTDVALSTEGRRSAFGALTLDRLQVRTRALNLEGAFTLAPDNLPQSFALTARLGLPGADPVLLPISGPETRVTGLVLDLGYDRTKDEGWSGTATLTGLDRPDFKAAQVGLNGSGRINRNAAGKVFGATVAFSALGLMPTDPALAQALGPSVRGDMTLFAQEGMSGVSVPQINLTGEGYDLKARLRIDGLDQALRMTGRAEATAQDLGRFSGLAGYPLGGRGTVSIEGSGSSLAGDFDVIGVAEGQDLRIGQTQIDNLMRGASRVDVSVRRDASGITLRSANLQAQSLSVAAKGTLASAGSALTADMTFADLGVLGGGIRGALTATASFTGKPGDGVIVLDGTGRSLAVGQAEADRLLAGTSTVAARLNLRNGQIQIETARIANPQVSAEAKGRIAGALRDVALTGRLANLGLLLPDFPGPVTVTGTALQDASGYRIDLTGRGPGQIDARVTGRVAASLATADLVLAGTAQAGLANAFIGPRAVSGPVRFDLRMNGRPSLAALSGRVSLSGGRISDPDLSLAFERTEAVADLSGGRARIAATTQLSTGGRIRVDGTVGMAAPFAGDLSVQLDSLRLRDPELFETTASGQITLRGPLTGGAVIAGAVDLGLTEVRIPSTGMAGVGTLPGLRHVNEPGTVRATRARAGLLGGPAGDGRSGGASFGLDVTIRAPQRVFIRGRGLDAELGGSLRLTGTTAAVVPSGGFQLIRGRLDILGKRLVLSEATMELEGDFVPYITIAAANQGPEVTSFVRIEGPATDPEVTFSSVPELPQEEVLAQLLFGRGLTSISPLQAAQLAAAVASLAGRGGEGLIGNLRKNFGLDDLDVSTAPDGSATLKAGKYLSENVYTEVELGQNGKTQLNLNLDLKPTLTVKGRVAADGQTGIGIFLEKDY